MRWLPWLIVCLLLPPVWAVPYAGDGFTVDFPARPEVVYNEGTRFHAQSLVGKTVYMATWIKNPGGASPHPDKALEATLAAMLAGAHMKLLSKKPLKLQGFPGYEYSGEANGKTVWARLFIVKDRCYQMTSAGADSPEGRKRFWNSFKLK